MWCHSLTGTWFSVIFNNWGPLSDFAALLSIKICVFFKLLTRLLALQVYMNQKCSILVFFLLCISFFALPSNLVSLSMLSATIMPITDQFLILFRLSAFVKIAVSNMFSFTGLWHCYQISSSVYLFHNCRIRPSFLELLIVKWIFLSPHSFPWI